MPKRRNWEWSIWELPSTPAKLHESTGVVMHRLRLRIYLAAPRCAQTREPLDGAAAQLGFSSLGSRGAAVARADFERVSLFPFNCQPSPASARCVACPWPMMRSMAILVDCRVICVSQLAGQTAATSYIAFSVTARFYCYFLFNFVSLRSSLPSLAKPQNI
jgi:hypothetical protein